jgi:hypothetical protein
MKATSELRIIIPGVCGPIAETRSLENNPHVKHWVSVLSRARCEASPSTVNDVITSLFKLGIEGDFPSAAFTLLGLNRYDESSNYMFADPVHLQADIDHAILTSSLDLAISEQEAELFCEMLNQHFNQDGFCFININKDQWVISSKDNIQINTTALVEAIGRNVNFILPAGDASGYWKQKLTEAQMLMHSHEINTIRENSGQQTINSLWLHGSGKLPDFDQCAINTVCSDDVLFKGLASHVQCDYQPLYESAAEYMRYIENTRTASNDAVDVLYLSALEHLVNYSDVSIWSGKLEEVLNDWFYPLLKMAYKNNISVTLYPCNGRRYQFSKYDRFKFWRSEKLAQHISSY